MLALFTLSVAPALPFAVRAPQAKSPDDVEVEYRLERIAADPAKPALPKEIPVAFAKLLDPAGLRLFGPDGKALCELWLRAELPLVAKPAPPLGVRQGRLAPGTFVGAMRTFGATTDYREQSIEAGVFGLRYFHQPSDGDHLGTSDSRDFLVVTSFAHDRDPAPVEQQDDLVALSVPASPSEHALVLYVADAPAEPAQDSAPHVFRRGEKNEWAAELPFRARPSGAGGPAAAPAETLRLALVLVGHVSH